MTEHTGLDPASEQSRRRGPSRGFVTVLVGVYAVGAFVTLSPDPRASLDVAHSAVPVRTTVLTRLLPRPAESHVVATLAPFPSDSATLEREAIARFAEAPLVHVLRRRTEDRETVGHIAKALVTESRRLGVAPSLLTALVLVENPQLDPDTVSSRGATGLMQVMPFHARERGCGSDDLTDVDVNICHGARVFQSYLKRTGAVRSALLRYNGCVAAAYQTSCARYPARVLRVAGRVRRELLRYAESERTREDAASAESSE